MFRSPGQVAIGMFADAIGSLFGGRKDDPEEPQPVTLIDSGPSNNAPTSGEGGDQETTNETDQANKNSTAGSGRASSSVDGTGNVSQVMTPSNTGTESLNSNASSSAQVEAVLTTSGTAQSSSYQSNQYDDDAAEVTVTPNYHINLGDSYSVQAVSTAEEDGGSSLPVIGIAAVLLGGGYLLMRRKRKGGKKRE